MTTVLPLLRDALPEGVPVPVRWLHALGVSSALVNAYVRSGWLQALPGQAYLRPGPALTWPAALYAAQQLGLPVHVGHLSALAVQGLSHYQPLGAGGPLHLYLPSCPPVCLASLPVPASWHHDALLEERVTGHRLNPPSLRDAALDLPVAKKLGLVVADPLPWPVFVSSPERAALELAAGLTRGDSWDTAYETFSGLSMLRPSLVQTLLERCTRVVTKRLFLHLASEGGHAWRTHLDLTRVDLGKGDRQVVVGRHARSRLARHGAPPGGPGWLLRASWLRCGAEVLPLLGAQEALALKGGTAINLFVQHLPRLSVDIDLAYTGLEDRDEALARIHAELLRMKGTLEALGLQVQPTVLSGTPHVVKLIVRDRSVQIKVEVSPVLRGTVYPPERRQPSPEVQARFGFAEVPMLALPDLYAGKLVAALDRQHPRDLYDVRLFLQQERLTREVVLAFLVYLVSHGRPLHEVLRPRFKNIRGEYERAFRGMTVDEVPLEALEQARVDLLEGLPAGFTADDRAFLMSVAKGRLRWDLLPLDGISDLPAVRWKLHNIGLMTPAKRAAAVRALESALETGGQQDGADRAGRR